MSACWLLAHEWRHDDICNPLGLLITERCIRCGKGRNQRFLSAGELRYLGLVPSRPSVVVPTGEEKFDGTV